LPWKRRAGEAWSWDLAMSEFHHHEFTMNIGRFCHATTGYHPWHFHTFPYISNIQHTQKLSRGWESQVVAPGFSSPFVVFW
jgi:hypothetical protein